MNTENTIDLTDHSHVAIVLMNAVAKHLTPDGGVSPEFQRIVDARKANGGHLNKVVALVDGVEVPILDALADVLKQYEAAADARAGEKALKLISAAGLDNLRATFEQVEEQLKDALIKVGARFDEDY